MPDSDDDAVLKQLQKAKETIARLTAEKNALKQQLLMPDSLKTLPERSTLKESRDQYRKLFNHASDMMFVLCLDEDKPQYRRFLDANNVALKRLGFSRDEILMKGPEELCSADEAGCGNRLIAMLLNQGQARFETCFCSKSGKILPLEISALHLTIGGENFYMIIACDVTARKAAEKALQESERLYRLVADNVHDVIWTTDIHLRPRYISPSIRNLCKKTGVDKDQIVTQLIVDAPFSTADLSITSFPVSWESALYGPDKKLLFFESLASEMPAEERNAPKILVVTREITTTKRIIRELDLARQKAQAASLAKSSFLANMSHEVRTPMNGVLGMLQLLKMTPLDDEQLGYIETASASGKSLLAIINDILDYSKIEAGKLQINPENFHPREILEQVGISFTGEIDPARVELVIAIAEEIPEILFADPQRLRQILYNVIGNAVKFTEKGSITVKLELAEKLSPERILLHCQVIDTGIGMPLDAEEKLFSPFTQATVPMAHKPKGTGLGLAIVKQLVTAMGGTISLKPNLPEGTIVSFTVEAGLVRSRPQVTTQPPEPMLTSPGKRLSVLVAEDENINQQILKTILTKLGHRSRIARDGKETLDLLLEDEFDIILMDVQMPELDGLETTRRIRRDPRFSRHSKLPILALTAYAMAGDQENCLAAGMDDYLAKPVDIGELGSKLRALTQAR